MFVFRIMLCGGIIFAVFIGVAQAEMTVDISIVIIQVIPY